jgi:hypothetical protein
MTAHVDAVVEAPWFETAPPWPWPIADVAPFNWLTISGSSSDAVVGSVFARLVTDNSIPLSSNPGRVLEGVLADEELILPGGLRVRNDQILIGPGCCGGLERWREWIALLDSGDSPWLGHDPWPWAECVGDCVRVWADGGMNAMRGGEHIDLDRAWLVDALHRIREDLLGFLECARRWSEKFAFPRSAELVTRLDLAFQISAPIEIGNRGAV